MNFFRILAILIAAAGLLFIPVSAQDTGSSTGDIILHISGFRNTEGYLGILLFADKKGFPAKNEGAFQVQLSTFSDVAPVIKIPGMPYGIYAVTVLHDENMNGEMDTNWIGLPREGVGVSNNARSRMGPPKFRDAKFELSKSSITLDIKVNYLGKK